MSQLLRLYAVAAGLLAVLVPSAIGQVASLPTCPDDREAVSVEMPDIVRLGESYAFSVYSDSASVAVIEVLYLTDSGDGFDGALVTESLSIAGRTSVDVVRAAPIAGESLTIVLTWRQDGGSAAACDGELTVADIPLVPAGVSVGRPGVARFEGRYSVDVRGDRKTPTWTAKPVCELFGCGSKVRSTAGLRGKFSVTSRGRYELNRRFRAGYCDVTYADGRRARWTVFEYETIRLKPVAVRDGVAIRLRGTKRYDYEAPSDPTDSCAPGSQVFGMVVRRR